MYTYTAVFALLACWAVAEVVIGQVFTRRPICAWIRAAVVDVHFTAVPCI